MNSADDTYLELPLDEPKPGWVDRLLVVCSCPIWFVLDWFYTRNWRALLASLPALLAAGTAAAILLIGKFTPDEYRLKTWQERAKSAWAVKDTAAADVYGRRLARRPGAPPSAIYCSADIAAQQGDYDRARSLMRRIAPENAAGYPPAHFWLAKDILRDGGRLAPRAGELLEHHLTQFLAGGETNWEFLAGGDAKREAHALLGQLYCARRDVERAIPHVEQAARHWPDRQLVLAGLYDQQKNIAAARTAAQRARDFFSEQAKADPKAWGARVQWAWSEALLNNYDQAVRILREGLTSSDPKPFHAVLVDVYLRWYASVPENAPGSLPKRLELLNSALAHGPDNPHLLTLLADLATRDWDGAGEALGTLREALTRGTAPAAVHFILGTRALLQGNVENARTHLELAYQGNLQMPAVLNNLAWALANREQPDLERALQLAQAAKKLSNHPEIPHTIGTILARLGRHREALPELETALRAFPNRPDLHGTLAETYATLGDAGLAELHRQLAKPNKKSP